MNMIVSAIGQGLLWGILGIALFLTFRILNFPDMTVEGTFPLGAATAVSLITRRRQSDLGNFSGFYRWCLGRWNYRSALYERKNSNSIIRNFSHDCLSIG